MSPQVALVSLGTPYGAYHFGYVVSPILKDAASGLYMLMPGVAEGDGSPLLAFLHTPHKKPTPLALVLLELRRESVLVKEGESELGALRGPQVSVNAAQASLPSRRERWPGLPAS
jgi:hypothetical protein